MPAVSPRASIRFILNDRQIELAECLPTLTLLDFLRLDQRLTGTKEGCAEGDCGACTVLVGRLTSQGDLRYESVNACIRFVATLDGCHVVTVEALAKDGVLHPLQQAMVDEHGSQCGFCTPGIVMSLYALWMRDQDADQSEIERALQGNLCRCTGYAPIVRAALVAGRADATQDALIRGRAQMIARLQTLRDGTRVEMGVGNDRLVLPSDIEDLASAIADYPNADIVSGATDVGLWVTKLVHSVGPVIFIGHIEALQLVEESDQGLRIGAAVSYSDARTPLLQRHPFLEELWDRIGGEQVRNLGTIGGNIANGSPIGDTPPPFIVLGARLILRSAAGSREIPLESFFIEYGKQDLRPGEFVEAVFVPDLPDDATAAVYKISKRRDEDITAVLGAFRVLLDDQGRVTETRIAYGGMAATPKRAAHAEAALKGQLWGEGAVSEAMAALDRDFAPLDDWRASSEYRMLVSKNLLRRFWLETRKEPVRLERVLVSAGD